MFWEIFEQLCKENNTTPNGVAKILGFSNATATKWKNGSVPSATTVSSIASYFGVSVGYLLGEEDKKEKPTDTDGLSENMKQLIAFARSVPDDKVELVLKVIKSIVEDA